MTETRFHQEYLPLAQTLYRIAYYILESETEAEDALQEVYAKLWEARDGLDGVNSPKAYAIRMLKNLCLDRIRKAKFLSFHRHSLPEVNSSVYVSVKVPASATKCSCTQTHRVCLKTGF